MFLPSAEKYEKMRSTRPESVGDDWQARFHVVSFRLVSVADHMSRYVQNIDVPPDWRLAVREANNPKRVRSIYTFTSGGGAQIKHDFRLVVIP